MHASAEGHQRHDHGTLPTRGRALDSVALSATLHCLTGCAIGEVLGMFIGTAIGLSDWETIALAVALAFLFGYALTSLPLLRSGMALRAVVPVALASDTFSIAIMEVVDNAIMLMIPGAMEAGVGSRLFWGSLSVALVIAGVVAFPVNRWLLARGKGHAAVHRTGVHGGPPTRAVAIVAGAAAVFGTAVLVAEATGGDQGGHGAPAAAVGDRHPEGEGKGAPGHGAEAAADPVRGLAVSEDGLALRLERTELPRGRRTELRFGIVESGGRPVRDFEVEHEKRMHLIVVRRDLTAFQHLHPRLGGDGEWSTAVTLGDAGSYRVFADFKRRGENRTLAAELAVDGSVNWRTLPAARTVADAGDGYRVRLGGATSRPGAEAELTFAVTRDGQPVEPDPYLGAKGHLVALREGDLAYLHVHPAGHGQGSPHGGPVAFATQFPSQARYRLFLQFRHAGKVRTAAFTHEVSR
jgi:hypothetical protein